MSTDGYNPYFVISNAMIKSGATFTVRDVSVQAEMRLGYRYSNDAIRTAIAATGGVAYSGHHGVATNYIVPGLDRDAAIAAVLDALPRMLAEDEITCARLQNELNIGKSAAARLIKKLIECGAIVSSGKRIYRGAVYAAYRVVVKPNVLMEAIRRAVGLVEGRDG